MGTLRTIGWIFFLVSGTALSALPLILLILLIQCSWTSLSDMVYFEYLLYAFSIIILQFAVSTAFLGTDYDQQKDTRTAIKIFCLLPFFLQVFILLSGLYFGLDSDYAFIVILSIIVFHAMRRAPSFLIPVIPRNPSSFRDPGNQINRSWLGKAQKALNKKNLHGFYMNLGKSMEQALKHIEGSRSKFSLWTRISMWRTHFGGGLLSDLKAAERFFHAKRLKLTKWRLKSLWDSAHRARKERNTASHSKVKPLQKNGTGNLLNDVRQLVLALENWRVDQYSNQ